MNIFKSCLLLILYFGFSSYAYSEKCASLEGVVQSLINTPRASILSDKYLKAIDTNGNGVVDLSEFVFSMPERYWEYEKLIECDLKLKANILKTRLSWSQEGFEGDQVVYFIFSKEDRIIHLAY